VFVRFHKKKYPLDLLKSGGYFLSTIVLCL
jgi:hypothetical protein